jgi:glycosyltransferase involved in cell wall biosynthesis
MWPEVRRKAGDVRLVLVGGTTAEEWYPSTLWALCHPDRGQEVITITGGVKPSRVAEMLQAADLFVLASESEGWCNAIAEALACGCPVVVTDVGGNREQLDQPGLGKLVPYGQWEAFAEEVCRSLDEPWDRPAIARHGGRRTWRQAAEECVDVFEDVLGRRLRESTD